jgi:DNA mismatch endonuclease, patch repair protein
LFILTESVFLVPTPDGYPHASSVLARKTMLANRRRDTNPERQLRSLLHRRGLRFRCDHPIVATGRRVRVDVAFMALKIAVFVDGCFWHQCPEHGRMPRANRDYWLPKLNRNVERDREVDLALQGAGWTVIRLWEHLHVEDAAAAVIDAVQMTQDANSVELAQR